MTNIKRRSVGSVTAKRGLWYAVVSAAKGRSGRRERIWSKGYKKKYDAERKLAQMLIEDRIAKDTRRTVSTVLREYIKRDHTPRGVRSPTTTQGYEYLFRKLALLHDLRAEALDAATIEDCYNQLRAGGLSETTIHHAHNLLFAAFKWATKRSVGLMARNPFTIYDDIERPRRRPTNARAYTREQARKLLTELSRTKHCNALIFCLASACRRGEVCGLKWACIDFDRRVAVIRESRYQVKGFQGQKTPKAHLIREIPLNKNALRALRQEQARQKNRHDVAADAWTDTGFVFTDELGNPLSPMALTNAFSRCARLAGSPTTRLHDLRHTAATFILSAGGNPVAASKILGHSDKATTLRMYGHVIDADTVDAAASIDSALKRKIQRRTRLNARKRK